MADFDTHGGIFTPLGYTKIGAGGTHEQNPNGGVQLGVDNQGVPNLLEENETVYNDYVFSNRIRITKEMCEKHNLPPAYAGKLYSEVADQLADEALEHPLDPISSKGIKVMLTRAMDAQEEQKANEERASIEEEVNNLSPEEFAELQNIMAQQQNGDVMPVEVSPEQAMPGAEMPIEQVPVQPGQQVFAGGGDMTEDVPPEEIYTVRDNTRTPFVEGIGYIANVPTEEELAAGLQARAARQQAVIDSLNDRKEIILPDGEIGYINAGSGVLGFLGGRGLIAGTKLKTAAEAVGNKVSGAVRSGLKRIAKGSASAAESVAESAKTASETAGLAKNTRAFAGEMIDETKRKIISATKQSMKAKPKNIKRGLEKKAERLAGELGGQRLERAKATGQMLGSGISYGAQKVAQGTLTGVSKAADALSKASVPKWVWPVAGVVTAAGAGAIGSGVVKNTSSGGGDPNYNPEIWKEWANSKADGGNLYSYGTDGLDRNSGYSYYNNNGNYGASDYAYYPVSETQIPGVLVQQPSLQLESPFGVAAHYARKPIGVWNPQAPGQVWTGYVAGNAGGNSAAAVTGRGSGRRAQGVRSSSVGTKSVPFEVTVPELDIPTIDESYYTVDLPQDTPLDTTIDIKPVDSLKRNTPVAGNAALPTWSRYAGAIGAGVSALINAGMPRPSFIAPEVRPVLPTGSLRVVPQEYRAIDPNLRVNTIQAQGNSTARRLRNSGLGPSTGAHLVAADKNMHDAVGAGFTQDWTDANARRNAVIAANNAGEQARANFDYQVMAARAHALNQASMLRSRYDLLAQQLRNEDDSARAAAISSQMNAIAQALSNIGRENFVINQVNGNTALTHGTATDGTPFYKIIGGLNDINF